MGTALLVIVGIIAFFFVIWGKIDDAKNKAKREAEDAEIAYKISRGQLIKCSDGKTRTPSEKYLWEKRIQPDYQYLIRRNFKTDYLDNLSDNEIKRLSSEKHNEEEEAKKKEEERKRKWADPLERDTLRLLDLQKKYNILCGLYLIYNKTSAEYYIGSSTDIVKRLNHHLNLLRNNKHHSYKLQDAFIEDGEINFKFYVLDKVNKEEHINNFVNRYGNEYGGEERAKRNLNSHLKDLEQEAISRYNPVYNVHKDVYKYRDKRWQQGYY